MKATTIVTSTTQEIPCKFENFIQDTIKDSIGRHKTIGNS